jgi:hypothetical protein
MELKDYNSYIVIAPTADIQIRASSVQGALNYAVNVYKVSPEACVVMTIDEYYAHQAKKVK